MSRLKLVEKTNMMDYAIGLYKDIHGDNAEVPEGTCEDDGWRGTLCDNDGLITVVQNSQEGIAKFWKNFTPERMR